jgi:hypothetical protein
MIKSDWKIDLPTKFHASARKESTVLLTESQRRTGTTVKGLDKSWIKSWWEGAGWTCSFAVATDIMAGVTD